ncbi:MAG: NADH-quinone oxidoreductase subunit E [Thermococci archaeon]|nr:NADH-quinone oxidoreductase subunit E [Thermococci archaeon]
MDGTFTLMIAVLMAPLFAALMSLTDERVAKASNVALSSFAAVLSTYALARGLTLKTGHFYMDFYSSALVAMISWIYLFASLASLSYTNRIKNPFFPIRVYWALLGLFAFTMIFTALSRSIGWMWIGLEGTTIVSALLTVTDAKKRTIEGAWRYIIVASSGLAIAFLSIIIVYSVAGTLQVGDFTLSGKAALLAAVLALVGFGTKAGLFPMHSWLPDAHGSAPSPVSAMLSGTLLPTALLVYMRVYTAAMPNRTVFRVTLLFGVLTVIMAAIFMASQTYLKRLLAYSSMDVMGVATAGIALGYHDTTVMKLVFLLFAVHAFSKGALFISGGSLISALGTRRIDGIRGLFGSTRFSWLTVSLSALAVTGAPPFGVFIAELFIVARALRDSPGMGAALLIGLLLSFLALNWHVSGMVFGRKSSDASGEEAEKRPDIGAGEEIVPFVMVLAALGLSLWAWGVIV